MVARHRLLDGKGRYSAEIRNYLETLRRKPGALARSLALRQGDEGLAAYEARYKGDPLGFTDFLSGASEPTDRGKRIAEASIAQLRRTGENVKARRRRWIREDGQQGHGDRDNRRVLPSEADQEVDGGQRNRHGLETGCSFLKE